MLPFRSVHVPSMLWFLIVSVHASPAAFPLHARMNASPPVMAAPGLCMRLLLSGMQVMFPFRVVHVPFTDWFLKFRVQVSFSDFPLHAITPRSARPPRSLGCCSCAPVSWVPGCCPVFCAGCCISCSPVPGPLSLDGVLHPMSSNSNPIVNDIPASSNSFFIYGSPFIRCFRSRSLLGLLFFLLLVSRLLSLPSCALFWRWRGRVLP